MKTQPKLHGLAELPPHVAAPDPSIYLGDDYIVLDFETTTIGKGSPLLEDNRIVLASWKEGTSMRSVFGSEFEMGELVQAVERAGFIVAHNAKFELGWLKRCGVDLRRVVVYDTMVGDYVLGGNRYALQNLSLNKVAGRYGEGQKHDLIGLMFACGIPTETIPQSWLRRYCERDVELTERVFLKQRTKLHERGQLHLLYSRCLLTPVLADIEFNGLQLDEEKVNELMETMEEEYARKTAALQDFAGGVPPSATAQKRDYIFGTLGFKPALDYKGSPILTGSGNPSVSADALSRLRPVTKKQRTYLSMLEDWSSMHSDVTKYLRKFKDCCEQAGGVLLGSFNQCNTRTHRLSSTGVGYAVQLQNLNRRFKPLFRARRTGWLVGEADGAQLEFRVAAHLGRDGVALTEIVEGVDIHAFSADIIGVSRQEAKRHTFKPLYGGTSGTERERAYYSAFADKYQGISGTQRGWTHTVLRAKKLETEWGMIFYWPQTTMKPSGYITNTQSIYNYPVQCLATAEIIPIAMVCAWHRMRDMQSFLVNTVHDSIIAEVHPDETELWHEVAQQCLIEDAYVIMDRLYKVKLTVPLGAGVKLDTHWGVGEETKYEARPELYEGTAKEEGML